MLNWFWITIYCFNGLDNTSNTNKRIYLEIYFSKGSWTVLKVTLVLFILYYSENQPWRRYVVLTYVLIWVECESQIVGNNLIFLLLLWLVCVARLHSTVQTTAAASVITFSSPCEVDFVQWFVMTMNNCFGKSSCCIMGESVLKCDILLDDIRSKVRMSSDLPLLL